MSDTKFIFVPSMSLNYEDNLLESVGIGGELYRRETPLGAENAVLKAENAKLRELLQRLLAEYRYTRARPRAVYLQHEERMRAIERELRELGVET